MIEVRSVRQVLVVNYLARGPWCALPYPGHLSGCPNLGTDKSKCPPNSPLIDQWADLKRESWFVIRRFDLYRQIARMRAEHPQWSDRQCVNCRYWQGRIRRELREVCEQMCLGDGKLIYTLCPEGMGVNVVLTLKRSGVPIEVKPIRYVTMVAMVAHAKQGG